MELLLRFFLNLTPWQIQCFSELEILYFDWNQKINLISRKDIDALYERHVLHSLSIALFYSFSSEDTFLDVGTGGGFPGLPLAILLPENKFTLIDSIGKKIMVVNDIINKLQLKNIEAIHINVKQYKQKHTYILSRAVCNFDDFVVLTKKNINSFENGGILYLKGGDLSNELQKYKNDVIITNIYEKINLPYYETKKIVYLPTKNLFRI